MNDPVIHATRKPTVNDIARVAGVSLATVDRVLNGRAGVRSTTIERVNDAINELGYVRDTAAANLARGRVYQLVFLLPETNNEFVELLQREIDGQAVPMALDRTQVRKVLLPPFDPGALVAALDDLDASQTDGAAVFGPETPEVCDAVNRARERGIAVVALVSDLPNSMRDHFIGIDNVAAGRTAAQLLGRFMGGTGQVLVITGSSLARDHVERRTGFDALMAKTFPNLDVVSVIEGRDDPNAVRQQLPVVFRAYPNLNGIYSSAAGNPGLVDFLNEIDAGDRITVIAHDLTKTARNALVAGVFDALISQNEGHLIRSAVRLLKATADKRPFDHTQERIRTDIYLKENLPPV